MQDTEEEIKDIFSFILSAFLKSSDDGLWKDEG
jgi:hypothetical protein